MIQLGANNLSIHKDIINKLNVFPVPDGDTGTNMNLSMSSGVKELNERKSADLPIILSSFIRGLLMGARGNSGVILSQLFRGFSESLQEEKEISSMSFANALNNGVKVAYQSVTNPVEGTILTVAKDAATRAIELADEEKDIIKLLDAVVSEAKQSLERTPELLPILKEVGVVDSGGKGLVVIYEGFLAALKGDKLPVAESEIDMEKMIHLEHERSAQSFISADSIEYGYCTEFFVELNKQNISEFDENRFRNQLSEYGDSLLVAADKNMVKVHIHTEFPGKVMNHAQTFGELVKIDIENMRKQHESIVEKQDEETSMQEEKEYGIIAVASGSGLEDMFTSLGTTYIIKGGQTMNPSTEELLSAIRKVNAKHTFILPNNKNILMAANQAKLLSDKNVIIIPTKTIPQGISALFAFEEEASMKENEQNMLKGMKDVKTGLVTYATRDTVINQMEIKQGSYMGLNDETIRVTNTDKIKTVSSLLQKMVDEDDEIVTIFYGEDVSEREIISLQEFTHQHFEETEIELHKGNQPIYSFIIMIE
ncbi:DAK2 domain-containing protein [Pseudogracilibacillus sp. SO30301A]